MNSDTLKTHGQFQASNSTATVAEDNGIPMEQDRIYPDPEPETVGSAAGNGTQPTSEADEQAEVDTAAVATVDEDEEETTEDTSMARNSSKQPVAVYDGPFRQIAPVLLRVGNLEIELLGVLRASCLVYLVFSVVWMVGLVCLGMSLKFEILDLVYINTFVLTIALTYTFVLSLLIGVLIFHQVGIMCKWLM